MLKKLLKKSVMQCEYIIDNYRGNVNNFVYTLSRFNQTILTCQFQQLRSPTKETKQKDMHSKQEQSRVRTYESLRLKVLLLSRGSKGGILSFLLLVSASNDSPTEPLLDALNTI